MKALPIRTSLFSSYLIILLLGMGIAAGLAWRSVEDQYLETQRENLLAQARLTAAALQGQRLPDFSDEVYLQTSNVQPGIHTRVLGEQGAVILNLPFGDDTSVEVPSVENHANTPARELLQRPEIDQALHGQAATAVRQVAAAHNRRVLYAAAPILAEDGHIAGLVYLATPLPVAGLPPELLLNLGLAGLAAATLALTAGTLLARRIAYPVEIIARTASAISNGDLAQSIPTRCGIYELENLGQAFNTMIGSLRQSEKVKNAFIADVTHELRTPLTVIKGTVETLEDGHIQDTPEHRRLLASMQRETDRLIRLVNDLLVLTRADAGMLNLNIQPINLAELAHARASHLSLLADRRNVSIFITVVDSTAPPIVMADADRTAQVLDNLLDNAVRYAPQNTRITIALNRQGNEWHCHVSDCGPGIPREHLPFIFERFYRANVARDRSSGGSGLGLSIARTLILAQGGKISAESQPGSGTTLRFSLPATPNCHPTA